MSHFEKMWELRARLRRSLIEAARRDARIVGVLDYGSASEGRADRWSDMDVALFLRDEDMEEFARAWAGWAAQFGRLLLAYVGGVGHPWAIYEAEPLPLRVDFAFHPASQMEEMLKWPNSPTSVEALVWYDSTGGKLSVLAAQLVGQSLAMPEPARGFEQMCGDFWYYMLRTLTRLVRGQVWGARYEFNWIVLGNLHALLRMEADALERWRASVSANGIEAAITPARLAQLDACIPGKDSSQLLEAFRQAARLGAEVSAEIAHRHKWTWPQELAERTQLLLEDERLFRPE